MNEIINKIICLIVGHAKPERHITETERFIYAKRCSRCKNVVCNILNLKERDWLFKKKHLPPPIRSTREEIKKWEEYCEKKETQFKEENKQLKLI